MGLVVAINMESGFDILGACNKNISWCLQVAS